MSYRTARVGDIDIHYEIADYTPPWRNVAPDRPAPSRLRPITTPALILAGEDSPIVKEAMRKEMQQRLPGAKLVTLRGFGHGVHLLAPEQCAHEIRTFI